MFFPSLFVKKYSAEEIHAEIMLRALLFSESLKNEIIRQQKEIPVELQKKVTSLDRAGFTQSQNYKILSEEKDKIEEYNSNVRKTNDLIRFIQELNQYFEGKSFLIRYDDFEYIIKKYNLVCGLLSQYTGFIPEENLTDIVEVSDKLMELKDDPREVKAKIYPMLFKGIKKLYMASEVSFDKEEPLSSKEKENFYRFPFADNYNRPLYYMYNPYFYKNGKRFFIVNGYSETFLFIAAPAKDMKVEYKFSKRVIPKDPFVCSYSEFGIIIHSKWGDEAEDKVIKEYEELFKQIR